ncbi:putative Fe-containing alcohol dehydrogenase [Taphrina deformans PYCC 5710]|uniref:hydroxyacid-oxoacid transhydrogenase n=1 Tax=Taphrina deformans (strain PYCC 5710 / ATCC 11124 / CBS 356.35 / IMI 108563 / JCM 9778 / NBRC 8474) TaxID=1097556 RepID=R4X8Q2_TAPDE|nr:putative Fe-containing alcohol dehydrogenase [Taphrina deformans PYCC 5710]|eukprot:CCG81770.1 putative Fe-containing alcohol dehydrogenase [Taphrina deformans PYCC 5710]
MCASHGRAHAKGYATPVDEKAKTEYAFEMAASAIRYGEGVTKEVGMDFLNFGSKNVAVFTDANVKNLLPFKNAIDGLKAAGVNYHVYDKTRVEPKESKLHEAIQFARDCKADAFLAVGGGSVMDTAKIANLYTVYDKADFLDFVNAPLGKGLPVEKQLHPLIAVPTTSGTGSETTGSAIFDMESKRAKTGIASRMLKPTLGIVDPLNTASMPLGVAVSSGLDVLCHALESYTALPYHMRSPRPTNPKFRPAYQGANPISDMWSLKALEMCIDYMPRMVASNMQDEEARKGMTLAATYAGIGFGNAGVHLAHGMSYAISGMNKGYTHSGYNPDIKLIPHGVSVAVTAPMIFRFTAHSNPERHLIAAKLFGADTTNAKDEMAGEILENAIKNFIRRLDTQPQGIEQLGYGTSDIPELVEATLPQARVLALAPEAVAREDLEYLFDKSLRW